MRRAPPPALERYAAAFCGDRARRRAARGGALCGLGSADTSLARSTLPVNAAQGACVCVSHVRACVCAQRARRARLCVRAL